MATITMHLHRTPFERIKRGMQKVDARVNDVKRQCIAIGDKIEYISLEDSTVKMVKTVLKLSKFKNFKELKRAYPESEVNEDTRHYTADAVDKFGVIAIELSD